jgi:putative Holliday junction resolvase
MPKKPLQSLLCFDFGMKHIGVAIGQRITKTATPIGSVKADRGIPHWPSIESLIKEWKPDGIVVGIPLNMDGTKTRIAPAAEAFAKQLHERFSLPVFEYDERLSTIEAKEALFESGGYRALNKSAIDSYSAKIILESYLRNEVNDDN